MLAQLNKPCSPAHGFHPIDRPRHHTVGGFVLRRLLPLLGRRLLVLRGLLLGARCLVAKRRRPLLLLLLLAAWEWAL